MKALHEMGVAELGRALATRDVSSVEVTKHLLARVAAHQHLGAWLAVDEPHALEQAQVADQRRAVSSRFVSLTPGPTETAEIVKHEINIFLTPRHD